jgi:hypothetical protein
MGVIFGSEGTAQADFERMEEINREIELDTLLRSVGQGGSGVAADEKERKDVVEGEDGVREKEG